MSATKESVVVPLYTDLQAKNLFGTERNVMFTENLLECYFNKPKGTFRGCKIENSVVITSELIRGKKIEMDIKIELPNKDIINLEFYSTYDIDSETKSFVYITRVFGNLLNKGNLYSEINRVKQINFIYEDYLRKTNKPIMRYAVINIDDPFDYILKNVFEIDIVNLAIKDDLAYNGINEGLADWIRFIGAKDYKEMKEVSKGKPILEEALEEMERFSNNEEVQEYFTRDFLDKSRAARWKKEKAQMKEEKAQIKAEKNQMKAEKNKMRAEKESWKAEKRDLEKKLEESQKYAESKNIEIAKNMLKENINQSTIIKITGLSKEELEKL